MNKVDYDARLHAVYSAGRQLSPGALRTWTEAFARHLPPTRPLTWLDLGSGTGRMTPLNFSDRMPDGRGSRAAEAALPALGGGPQYETSELLVFQPRF